MPGPAASRRIAALVLVGLLALAAAGRLAPVAAASGAAAPTFQPTPPGDLLDAVRADAAQQAGVPVAAVQVARVEARQWSDASLGCPQPGQFYAQVITPGFLMVVRAGDRQLEYHTDARQRFVLCRSSSVSPGLPRTGGAPGVRDPWLPAAVALAVLGGLAYHAMRGDGTCLRRRKRPTAGGSSAAG